MVVWFGVVGRVILVYRFEWLIWRFLVCREGCRLWLVVLMKNR